MRKEEKACQDANLPQSQQDEGKRKKGNGAMSLTLLCAPYYALADRSLVTSTLAAVKSPATACHTQSRHLNTGGGGNWAVTRANNQDIDPPSSKSVDTHILGLLLHEFTKAPFGQGLIAQIFPYQVSLMARPPNSSHSLAQASRMPSSVQPERGGG